jgi:hypothetical protein
MGDFCFVLICLLLAWSWVLWLPSPAPPAPVVIPGPGPFTVQIEGQPDYHTTSWEDAWRRATEAKGGGKILVGR